MKGLFIKDLKLISGQRNFCLLLVVIGAVIALELVNTAIEAVVNMITTDYNVYAKTAKDTSAAAVLVMSIVSAVIGLIIFVPKFIELF